MNVPDLSKAPRFKYVSDGAAQAAAVAASVNDLNAKLVELRDALAAKYASVGLKIKLYDTRAKVDDLFYNPGNYGITNTTDSCLDVNDVSTANYAKNIPVSEASAPMPIPSCSGISYTPAPGHTS